MSLFQIGGVTRACGGKIEYALSNCWIYDSATNQWTESAPMLNERRQWFGIQLDGHRFLIAGNNTLGNIGQYTG